MPLQGDSEVYMYIWKNHLLPYLCCTIFRQRGFNWTPFISCGSGKKRKPSSLLNKSYCARKCTRLEVIFQGTWVVGWVRGTGTKLNRTLTIFIKLVHQLLPGGKGIHSCRHSFPDGPSMIWSKHLLICFWCWILQGIPPAKDSYQMWTSTIAIKAENKDTC